MIYRVSIKSLTCMVCLSCFNPVIADTAKSVSLKEAAGDRMLIGTAVMSHEFNNPALAKVIAEQFSCMTPGNETKPDALQRVKGKFTFDRADKIIEFAQANNMKVIGHTLLWHSQSPRWLFETEDGKPLSREEALENLKTHIQTVLKHFKGKIKGWDVVNEAVADGGQNDLRNTPAYRAIGEDYLIKAFQFAHEADPDVELYYNDYNIEMDYKRDRAIRVIKKIIDSGARIDAIGVQGHWLLGDADAAKIEKNLQPLIDLGLKIMITEMDIDPLPRRNRASADLSATEKEGLDPYKNGLPDDVQTKLAEKYGDIFAMFLKHPQITRVTLWGTHDGGTWLNDFPVRGRTNHPMLWDRDLKPKPARDAVLKALIEASKVGK